MKSYSPCLKKQKEELVPLLKETQGRTGVLMFPHDDFVIEPLPSNYPSPLPSSVHHRHRHHHGNKNSGSEDKSHRNFDDKMSSNPIELNHDRNSSIHSHGYLGDHLLNKTLNTSVVMNNSFHDNNTSFDLDPDEINHHDNQNVNNEGKSDPVNETPHIMYRRSALPEHVRDNYHATNDLNRYAKSKQIFHRARRKRSYRSSERRVETLVVVDQDMYQKHGRENVTTYVLSIFNIVSQLYQDTTLGYPIKIVLVGLVFLDGREPGLQISHHADKTLNSFCQWQAGIHNGRQKLHDHAVLLTGKDICSYQDAPCDTLGEFSIRRLSHDTSCDSLFSIRRLSHDTLCDTLGEFSICRLSHDTSCDTLGFAPIDGMCSELRSCIVNEDTGLSTAFTITHEMGHNFGMMHDGDGNNCKDTTGFIMSPTLSAQSGTFHWSTCSRHYMRTFLNAVQSECLTSHSRGTAELKFPNKLPGEIFNADIQCKWQFGSHSKQCTIIFGRDPCKNLFCHKRPGMCETKFLPAAEGTSCGSGRWCQQGKCVSYGDRGPTPINGWWTEWGHWSHCTRSCGGGIKTRTRECNNPRPQYGGKTCQGEESNHKMCNLDTCKNKNKNFREIQCEELAHENFRGWNYRWRTHRKHTASEAEDQCKLYCKADGYNFYYAMPREVTDGTRCNDYTTDICVQGKCRHVGCDLVVDSSARKDRCGVCKGDNSTCKIVENTFTEQPRKKGAKLTLSKNFLTELTYVGVVFLPRGSSSIVVEEAGLSHGNYLVLRNVTGTYYLNGNWKLNKEGVYPIAGTKFIYRRPYNYPESLVAEGPLLEDLVLEVLIQSENPGIHYSFTVPKNHRYIPPLLHNYTWSVVLTECSETCAGGEQIVTAHCHRDHREEVDPAYCHQDKKPGTGKFPCNTKPCQPRWITQPWNVCHKSCGGGRQKRRVFCVQKLSQEEERKIPRKYCDKDNKPSNKRECNTHECPPVWYHGPWSECSASCGKGIKTRKVVCRSKTSTGQVVQPDTMCTGQARLTSQKGCKIKRCPDLTAKWVVTAWSECTASCDDGTRTRGIGCTKKTKSGTIIMTHDKKCHHLDKPDLPTTETCKLKDCPVSDIPDWYASPWSECSVTCGVGRQTRLVHCMQQKYRRLATNCDNTTKPSKLQACQLDPCLNPGPECKDEFSWCHLVPRHNICRHEFYGSKCCLSCHKR
ncbi:A disintegrin and metalloproteinase with thrombospondin motifs 18 [Mactra antiquata]